MITKQPIDFIETTRLQLLPFSRNHLTSRYLSWLNDPKVVRFSELRHHTHTLESCTRFYETFRDSSNYFWAITLNDSSALHIGNITAHLDKYNSIAEVGILIGERQVWGKGFGFEAWQAVCQFLFKQLHIRKISAGTLSVNIAMLNIMKRMAMKTDGERKNHYLIEGSAVDVLHFSLFNDGF